MNDQREINQLIRDRANAFSLDVQDDALLTIEAMSGYDSLGSEQIADESNGSLSLGDSLALVTFRQTAAWRLILDGLQNMSADLQKKSDDVREPRDSRLSSMDQLQGITKAMLFIGSLFDEAEQRTAQLDTADKVSLGPEGREVIAASQRQELPSEAKVKKPLVDATASAVAFLAKGAN